MFKRIVMVLMINILAVPAFAEENGPSAAALSMMGNAELTRQYADKPMTASGVVINTGPNMYGLPSINLSDRENGKLLLMCVLPYNGFFSLGDITAGQEITVSGEYRGLYRGMKDGYIILKQCSPSGR